MENLLICVTGSIAAKLLYKIDQVLSPHFNIQYVLTDSAEYFVWETNSDNIELYSKIRNLPYACRLNTSDTKIVDLNNCYDSKFNIWLNKQSHAYKTNYTKYSTDQQYYNNHQRILHVDLAYWADKILVCPCSANTLVKIAEGLSDNLVTSIISTAMGLNKLIYLAPSTDKNTYINIFDKKVVHQLINKEFYKNVCYVPPTVDNLIYGDFGIGNLADINTICNIVLNKFWYNPIDWSNYIQQNSAEFYDYDCEGDWDIKLPKWPIFMPQYNETGSFGAIRDDKIHTGVDLYCSDSSCVHPVEPGEIVDIGMFTNDSVATPWFNNTQYVMIKGNSGYVLYGGIEVDSDLEIGDYIDGDGCRCLSDMCFGTVKSIFKDKNQQTKIRNYSSSRLHIELYKKQPKNPITWLLNTPRDNNLLDPTPYIWNFWY